MGTGKTERVVNTAGSGTTVSEYAAYHAIEGDLIRSQKMHGGRLRLKAGGHGQAGMDLLDKYGIQYKILKTYPNGVRVGNVLTHKNAINRKFGGHLWFPKSWTINDVKRAGNHVAKLRINRHVPDGQKIFGVYKGVRVGVIKRYGKIATVFPSSNQNFKKKGYK